MTVRKQGTAIIADLPAAAIAEISSGLGQLITFHAPLAASRHERADRDEAADLIMSLVTQQGYLQKAWNRPADELLTVRLGGRFAKEIFHILEMVEIEGPEIAEAIEALRTEVLETSGLLAEDGVVRLPDTP